MPQFIWHTVRFEYKLQNDPYKWHPGTSTSTSSSSVVVVVMCLLLPLYYPPTMPTHQRQEPGPIRSISYDIHGYVTMLRDTTTELTMDTNPGPVIDDDTRPTSTAAVADGTAWEYTSCDGSEWQESPSHPSRSLTSTLCHSNAIYSIPTIRIPLNWRTFTSQSTDWLTI